MKKAGNSLIALSLLLLTRLLTQFFINNEMGTSADKGEIANYLDLLNTVDMWCYIIAMILIFYAGYGLTEVNTRRVD